MTCSICKKEVNTYTIYFGSKCTGIRLPRVYICQECEKNEQAKKEIIEKMENDIKLYKEIYQ